MYKFDVKPADYLFSDEERANRPDCAIEELHGEDKVLNSKVIDDAFERILNDFKPKHNKVIFSLCSSSRPYITSVKWKSFHEHFGDVADLVICSNGGIIPIEYMCCFPFMQYDAHRANAGTDQLYKDKMKDKLQRFLDKFGDNYEVIVYSFLPSSRNAEAIREMNGAGGVLLPSHEVYRDIIDNGCPGVNSRRYPQCARQALKEMADALGVEIDLPFSAKPRKLF